MSDYNHILVMSNGLTYLMGEESTPFPDVGSFTFFNDGEVWLFLCDTVVLNSSGRLL